MAWAVPLYERRDVDAAGRKLAQLEFPVTTLEGIGALSVINNWRSSHSYPLNTFQTTLRKKGRKIERTAIVAQRIKRLESIHAKLARHSSMRMSQMQDIAGCRIVFKTMASVRNLIQRYKKSQFEHVLKGEKDYILCPKKDGYRSHHLVYSYKGTAATSAHDTLQVEVQIRTQMQHAWATAVEAVGIFTKQALKSSQGDQDWLRFFALMGSAIAAIEKCQPVPDTPIDKDDLIDETRLLAEKLRVQSALGVYNTSIQYMGKAKGAKYFLLSLDPTGPNIKAWRFAALQSEAANQKYTELESALPENTTTQIVLVSVDNVHALRRAYPNYFLDTNVFSQLVARVLNREIPDPQRQTILGGALQLDPSLG